MSGTTGTIERRARTGRDLTHLPDEVRARLDELAGSELTLEDLGVTIRQAGDTMEARRAPLELRAGTDGGVILDGYAAVYDVWYDVAGGPPYGWREMFTRGSFDKTVSERDDVRFLHDHEGLVMARTASGTLDLESDTHGLRVEAHPNPEMTYAADVVSSIRRGDVDQMSHAFRAMRQEWNDDYTERQIIEAKLFDVSSVGFPANPATVIQARRALLAGRRSGPTGTRMSVMLARAMADQARSRA